MRMPRWLKGLAEDWERLPSSARIFTNISGNSFGWALAHGLVGGNFWELLGGGALGVGVLLLGLQRTPAPLRLSLLPFMLQWTVLLLVFQVAALHGRPWWSPLVAVVLAILTAYLIAGLLRVAGRRTPPTSER